MIDNQKNTNVSVKSNQWSSFVIAKNKKIEQWRHFIKNLKETYSQLLQLMQKIDGISLWQINRKLNWLAERGIPKEDLKKGKIIISLPNKQSIEHTSPFQINFIEKAVNELEGFENLRLSHFYRYKPEYREKKTFSQISRWIEIEISQL